MTKHYLKMAIFPLLEVILFFGGTLCVDTDPLMSIIVIILSGLMLSFSLHITYHFQVHFKSKVKILNPLKEYTYSILMGIPFHFYYLLHINHHIYNNNFNDFTTTIENRNNKIKGKNIILYGLTWFRSSKRPEAMMQQGINEKYFSLEKKGKIVREQLIIFFFGICLTVINWKITLLYILLIYTGWVFISLHNYGQHLPISKGIDIGNSYYNRIYNFIFLNNGLHYEHHKYPSKEYWNLDEEKSKNQNNQLPHIIDGFRYSLTNNKTL